MFRTSTISFSILTTLVAPCLAQGGRSGGGGNVPPPDPAIAFADLRSTAIRVMNSDGTNVRTVYVPPSSPQPAMSPDGREIAFADTIGGTRGIFVVNTDGTGLRLVTPLNYPSPAVLRPAWSPVPTADGRSKLLFGDWDHDPMVGPGPHNLYVVDLDGTGRRRLTDDQTAELYAEWSHDATRIVFVEGTLRVATLGLVAGELAITSTLDISDLAGSPLRAATSIAFCGAGNTADVFTVSAITPDSGGRYDLWLVALADPTMPLRLCSTPKAGERWATFSPDDARIYYYLDGKGVHAMNSTGGGSLLIHRDGARPNHRRR